MPITRFNSAAAWLLAMTLTVIGVQAVCVDTARASCGDYLLDHQSMSQLGDQAGAEQSMTPSSPQERPARRPCDGPGCRQAPASPPPTAPERTQSNDGERWCACLEAFSSDAAASDWMRPEGRLLIPTGADTPIDHPPRG